MARDGDILFSIITPSTGNRPKALQKAVESVEQAARFAGLDTGQVEILIGFGGFKGAPPKCAYPVRCFNLPYDKESGNSVRAMLLKVANGDKIVFLDDDNVIKPYAFHLYLRHFDAEMVIGRIDTQLALTRPYLPVADSGALVRSGNINPLCLCMSRRLVVDRCGGWGYRGAADAEFLNVLHWYRRAHSVTILEEIVGIYDAGRSLDNRALSDRQMSLLDGLASEHGLAPGALAHSAAVMCAAVR